MLYRYRIYFLFIYKLRTQRHTIIALRWQLR